MVPHVVEDEVVALLTLSEVLMGVVDDMVGTDGADHVDVPRAANGCHFGAEGLGDLHGERPDASGRAVDQDLLTGLDLPLIAQQLQGGGCRYPDGRGLLKREVGRLGDEVVRTGTGILGKGACAPAEYLVA